MKIAFQGIIAGLGFAFAATIFSVASMQLVLIFQADMPPMTPAVLKAIFWSLLLGVPFGLVCAPLLKVRGGKIFHLLAIFVLWLAMENAIAIDAPMVKRMSVTGAVVALVLVLISRLVARKRPLWPPIAGVAMLITAVVLPTVRYRLIKPQAVAPEALAAAPAGAPDIVLIVLDTVRAQNVSAYGYERDTTPTFDALAAEGALFMDATAPSTWSLPSHASLFTGYFPSVHNCNGEHRYLDEGIPTLAEILSENGYDTLCFTANPHISENFGLTRGFRYSDKAWRNAGGGRSFFSIFRLMDRLGFGLDDKGGGEVAANFERYMDERKVEAPPSFVFINYLEAHFPYHQTPREFLDQYTELPKRKLRDISMELFSAQFGGTAADTEAVAGPAMDMYDAGIAYSDYLLKRAVEAIKAKGELDNTLLVVLSDHGELMGEHNDFGHGFSLLEHVTRVPFMMRYPKDIPAGTRVESGVSTVGTFATILDLAGIEVPKTVHVGSLTPAFEGKPAGLPVIAEHFVIDQPLVKSDPLLRIDVRRRSYRVGAEKIVIDSDGNMYLFNIDDDPFEERDLATTNPERLGSLMQELIDWSNVIGIPPINAEIEGGAIPEADPEAQQRLKDLGYLN